MQLITDIRKYQEGSLKKYCTTERLVLYHILDNVTDCIQKIEVTNEKPTADNFRIEEAAILKTIDSNS